MPFATAFPTASGKLEFVSDRMAQAGLDPVAGYTPAQRREIERRLVEGELLGVSATTVAKSPSAAGPATTPQGLTEPEDQLRPALSDETGATGTPPPPDEITPTAEDEGAGWEAAVEAAQAATPLIGLEQTKAVERINAYFNSITNLQGGFEQVDATSKRTTGRF